MRAVYAEHGAELYRFALRRLADDGLAQDTVQEVFVRAWRAAGRFDPPLASLRGWLFAIARNVVIDLGRRRAARPGLAWQDPIPEQGPSTDAFDDAVIASWMITDALRRISPQQREALVETYLRGRPYAEVARGPRRSGRHVAQQGVLRAQGATPGARRDGSGAVRPENHRAVREQLGAFALGQLDAAERVAVQAHLDGCPSCRAELNSIAPLAAPLRSVRPERIDDVPALPPGLGEAVMSRIRAEAGGEQPTVTPAPPDRAPWRTARRLQLAAAAAVIAIAAGGIGFGVGAQGSSSAPAPLEAVAVRSASPTVQAVADVVPHTWGVEIKLEATGFAPGRV